MKTEEPLNYELMKQTALEQFRSGKSLYGKDGAFAPSSEKFFGFSPAGEIGKSSGCRGTPYWQS